MFILFILRCAEPTILHGIHHPCLLREEPFYSSCSACMHTDRSTSSWGATSPVMPLHLRVSGCRVCPSAFSSQSHCETFKQPFIEMTVVMGPSWQGLSNISTVSVIRLDLYHVEARHCMQEAHAIIVLWLKKSSATFCFHVPLLWSGS